MPTGTCPYRNTSNQMMILHCIGPEAFFPEKVVIPFEDWLFRCPPHSRVIWTHGLKGAEQLDSINAEDLLLPAEVVPQEGADAGESRDLSIFPRLGGTNVRVFTNRDDDHQVKSRGIATVSCGGKISGCSRSRYRSTGQQVVPAVGAQILPERIPTASNKAANTSSLSIISIGLTESLLRPHSLPTALTTAPPKRG